jgi:hypothetical protein
VCDVGLQRECDQGESKVDYAGTSCRCCAWVVSDYMGNVTTVRGTRIVGRGGVQTVCQCFAWRASQGEKMNEPRKKRMKYDV